MKSAKSPPRPVYRKPKLVPVESITNEQVQAWAARHNEWALKPDAEKVAETLAGIRRELRELLRSAGVEFASECAGWARLLPGYAYMAAGGERVRFPAAKMPPEVERACEALDVLREVEASEGEARVLAAYRFGRHVERVTVEAALAKPVDSFARSRRKSPVTDDDVRRVTAESRTKADAAARLGISERQLRTRLARLDSRTRKPVRLPPAK